MIEIKDHKAPVYWCVYNKGLTDFAIGKTDVSQVTAFDRDFYALFDSEEELEKHVDSLMGVGWYKSQKTDLTLPD